MDAFGPALAGADEVVLTDIYAAGEDPIPGRRRSRRWPRSIRRGSRSPVDVVPRLDDVVAGVLRDRAARRRR